MPPRVVENRRQWDRVPSRMSTCACCGARQHHVALERARVLAASGPAGSRRWRTARRGTDRRCGGRWRACAAALARGVMQTRMRSCVPQDDCDAVEREVGLELPVDDVRGQEQRALAELRELLRQLAQREAVDRAPPARPAARRRRRPRRRDAMNACGTVSRRRAAGDAAHERLLLGDVLEVDGGHHRDAALDELLDVFVPLGVAAAGRVVVGQAVDEAEPGRRASTASTSITGTPSDLARRDRLELARGLRRRRAASGCMAAITTSSPRWLRRRPSSKSLNDLPTPDAYPRKILSWPRCAARSAACSCRRSASGSGRSGGEPWEPMTGRV